MIKVRRVCSFVIGSDLNSKELIHTTVFNTTVLSSYHPVRVSTSNIILLELVNVLVA
jgi:hypothetical protein